MKRWAIYTVLIYALALVLLTMPALWLGFHKWTVAGDNFSDYFGAYKIGWYWLWLAVLVAGQILLLLVPIDISQKRLPSRRKLKIPVIVSAFFLANLFFAGVVAVLCAAFKEDGMAAFTFIIPAAADTQNVNPWQFAGAAVITLLVFWMIWIIMFRNFAQNDNSDALIKRSTRWLLRGSILELIIAVPSHVIVRRRDDCCAPVGTFWGIATGISVMLLCFGPGVYFLFAERIERLKPKVADADK